ncbi:hypothetical protein G3O08_01770 [Cryomorpha ignava]|uniref:Uncharacterized protein n=1 Tax=Cryomorpha ignava TaxID=101383 RepID=A0A7K3WMJ7_9FLAO|nr:hypothetical protein [Cryomorpha ignava]NEN22231.1 hypothetical protein [Cryomorpha ignava]
MRWLFIVISLGISISTANAEDISAVVSESRAILTIKDVDRVEFEMFKRIKILSEKGSYHSRVDFYEKNFRNAAIYNVTVKDEYGKVVLATTKRILRKRRLLNTLILTMIFIDFTSIVD